VSGPRASDRCGICLYKQKLRADGTLVQHDLWIGGRYWGRCPGTHKTPAETQGERDAFFASISAEPQVPPSGSGAAG